MFVKIRVLRLGCRVAQSPHSVDDGIPGGRLAQTDQHDGHQRLLGGGSRAADNDGLDSRAQVETIVYYGGGSFDDL